LTDLPRIALLKNNNLIFYADNSYLTINRNPNKEALKQNLMKERFGNVLKMMNKTELLKDDDFNTITEFAERYEVIHDLNKKVFSEKHGIKIKDLGTLSRAQVKNCRKAVETMTSTVLLNYDKRKSYKNQQYVTFHTLTLPSIQIHSDKVIRKCFTRWLDSVKKVFPVKFYVWKAEAQENGNIHFHVVFDRWMDEKKLVKLWNFQLDKFGYIDAYREKAYRENLTMKYPFATVKAESLHKDKKGGIIKNSVAYIMKYMSKLEKGKRPIIGKVFGCSNEVKKLQYPRFFENENFYNDLLNVLNSTEVKEVFSTDIFQCYSGRMYDIVGKTSSRTWRELQGHYRKQKKLTFIDFDFDKIDYHRIEQIEYFTKEDEYSDSIDMRYLSELKTNKELKELKIQSIKQQKRDKRLLDIENKRKFKELQESAKPIIPLLWNEAFV
jgi:hypothetical protein